ncbi:DUF4129 domain-containing protein [Flavobacteriaceae bacterium AU392]|nr:DUF4129 domain-containing protein [Flavobacteriaceae bacterium]RKM83630.1 DUF4129 domain-containing protein [Flavobacteriaceae bacterium AU392]
MYFFKLIIIYFLFTLPSFGQQDSLSINQYDNTVINIEQISDESLETYKNDTDFNYVEIQSEENFLDKFKRWLRNILTKIYEAIFGVGTASGFLYFMFNIFPYIVLAFLIYLLLRFFLKVNSRNIITGATTTGSISFSEEEEIIKNQDISSLIKEAVKQKNYRLAIRYYYLLSLKYLSENNLINWEQQKTNEDYIKEIEKETLRLNFSNITKIYDYVWYGEFNIDELKFEQLKTSFESLNKKMRH